jgi:fused signal recognition particle receptor
MAESRRGFLGRLLGEAPERTPEPQSTAPQPADSTAEAADRKGWWDRLKSGLARSSQSLSTGIADVFSKRKLDAEALEELEELLLKADLGVDTAARVVEALSRQRLDKEVTPEEVRAVLAAEVEKVLTPVARPLQIDSARSPYVILVVGVNGTGKTTTIGKLAARFRSEGKSVTLCAGDTFRAAAIEQLKIWGERAGAPVVAKARGADSAGLAFEAFAAAKESGADVLLIDTAGRLQNKAELMAELTKIVRVLKKQDESAPHAVLLTLDATTGQNALNQVDVFRAEAGVTGLVMTKLDGTARGGILVAISARHGLPVHFIGVGEAVEDLQPFSAHDFARAIAGLA